MFMADQQKPIRRQVALKVLKPDMETRQVVDHFEAERQVLANMDLATIARVFSGVSHSRPGGRKDFSDCSPIWKRIPEASRLRKLKSGTD